MNEVVKKTNFGKAESALESQTETLDDKAWSGSDIIQKINFDNTVTNIRNKLPKTIRLGKNAELTTKITDVENKIPNT